MPVYEFRCADCGHVFEELCRLNEDGGSLACPSCRHVGVRRLISVFAAHGLENGHIAVGRPRPGQADGGESKGEATGESKGESKGESNGPAKAAGGG